MNPDPSHGGRVTAPVRAIRVLWIAPNLNHYKARFLSRLAATGSVDLTVLAGADLGSHGHQRHEGEEKFSKVEVPVPKREFHRRASVYRNLWRLLGAESHDWVLMPLEKKHIPLIIFLAVARRRFGYRLVSYNHPLTKSAAGRGRVLNRKITKTLFCLYDRIIFYTEASMNFALAGGLLDRAKAAYANNTLDTEEIFRLAPPGVHAGVAPRLLFIGRLIPNKRIDLLFSYLDALRLRIPDLCLSVIGDGPERALVQRRSEADPWIEWLGALSDETRIAEVMGRSHAVFIPGHSGLSIVHAFCYGKPYITLAADSHPPEFSYLEDGKNGLVLSGYAESDCDRVAGLLKDQPAYRAMCESARQTARGLTVEAWCERMGEAFQFEERQAAANSVGAAPGFVGGGGKAET